MSYFDPHLMLILPSPSAVAQAQERLLEESPERVILEPRLFTFERLSMEIASEIIPEKRRISRLGQDMILMNILARDKYINGWPGRPAGSGLRRQFLELLGYLKEGGVSPEQFADLAGRFEVGETFTGFAELYADYEKALQDKGLIDRSGVRYEVLSALKNRKQLRVLSPVSRIVVRDFTFLSPYQLQLIKALIRVLDQVEVDLVCPDWVFDLDLAQYSFQDNPFQETLTQIRSLETLDEEGRGLKIVFKPPAAALSTPPAYIARRLFCPKASGEKRPNPTGQIEILAAPGRYAEVEAIGRRIAKLLDQGCAPESIAVAFNDLGIFGQLIEDVFRRFNLPLFFRRGAPLNIQAPVRTLLALLRLARSHWERNSVLDLLASPYLDFGLNMPWPRIEELSLKAGVTDNRGGGGWQKNLERLSRFSLSDRADIAALQKGLDLLESLLKPLSGSLTWAEFAENVDHILNELHLREMIQRKRSEFFYRDVPSLEGLWACLNDLKKAAEEAGLSRIKYSPAELERGILNALKDRSVGQRPAGGSGVMILSVYDLHGLTFDYLFLGGLNEGEFPRPHLENPVLSDDECRELNRAVSRPVLTTSVQDYRTQELLFYHALAATQKYLCLSFSRMDEQGRMRLPSALVDDVLRLWPRGEIQVEEPAPQVLPPLKDSLSAEELIGGLALHLLRKREKNLLELNFSRELFCGLSDYPEQKQRWDHLVRRAKIEQDRELGIQSSLEARVSPEILKPWLSKIKKYKGFPILSPTFMEDYGRCPFRFWSQKILKLEPPEEERDEISPLDEGTIYHQIIFAFFSRCQKENILPLSGDPKEEALLSETASRILDAVENNFLIGRRPLWLIKREGILRGLRRWLTREQDRDEEFVPTFFEWKFGPEEPGPPVQIPLLSGGQLFFQGRVDQVDMSPDQSRVIDYKLSGDKNKYTRLLRADALGKSSFQAPVYQLAAAHAFNKPAQAMYYLLRSLDRLGPTPLTSDDLFEADLVKRQKARDEGSNIFFNQVEDTWGRLTGGDFPPAPETGDCDYCPYRFSCRGANGQTEA